MQKPFALIVEDDRDIAALFRHVLDIAGYRTEVTMDGREALERLKIAQPDIVLLDLTLPGVPGAKILEWMRSDIRLHSVPIVVITGHANIAENLPVQPDLVLLKPVNLGQLSNLVQRLRNAPLSMPDEPWDSLTHLYNKDFFTVRLTYSLERASQFGVSRFGVLFVDVEPFSALQECVDHDRLEIFLREIAGHLKTALRPTDTVSRFEGGLFLGLVEDIPDYSVPSAISARISRDLASLIAQKNLMDGLRANVGLILCTAQYGSVGEILGDVDIARKLAGTDKASPQYERDTLRKLRPA